MSEGGAVLALPQRKAPSMMGVAFRVADWAACRVAGPDHVEWFTTPAAESAAADAATALPALLRRRVSAIGQKAFAAALRLSPGADDRFIFCSRHGEYRRTQSLLEALALREPASPADFSLSVHHALAGLLSIALTNSAGHTAVAAGSDSLAFGLIEAAACLAAGGDKQVLLVYFDEPLPEDYAAFCEEEDAFAAAFLLTPAGGSSGDILLSLEPADRTLPRRSATGQAADFVRFLCSGDIDAVSSGSRGQWHWRRADG
jgi:Beta-ketoacyl synthase, N-terminal domain